MLRDYRERRLPLGHVTVSTDAYGSLPRFDERGRLVEYGVASPGGAKPCSCWHSPFAAAALPLPASCPRSTLPPGALLAFLRAMVAEEGWALEEVLPLATANPARLLRLGRKGRIAVGADADVLLLEARAPSWRAGGPCIITGPAAAARLAAGALP